MTRLDLYNQGLSDSKIAEIEGVKRQAVQRWRKRNGLVSHSIVEAVPDSQLSYVSYRYWYKHGLNDKEISEKMNVDISYIYQWRKADAEYIAKQESDKERYTIRELVNMYKAGKSIWYISEMARARQSDVVTMLELNNL